MNKAETHHAACGRQLKTSGQPSKICVGSGLLHGDHVSSHVSGLFNTVDDELASNANGIMRQLFNPTPSTKSGEIYRRSFTPTEEDLSAALHKIGMVPNPNIVGDVLEYARRGLKQSVFSKQESFDGSHFGTVTKGTLLNQYNQNRAVQNFGSTMAGKMGVGPATNHNSSRQPGAVGFCCSHPKRKSMKDAGARVQKATISNSTQTEDSVFKSTANEIDPYIPEMSSVGGFQEGSVAMNLPWPGSNETSANCSVLDNFNSSFVQYQTPKYNLSASTTGHHSTPIGNSGYERSSPDSNSELHPQNYEQLKREAQELKRQIYGFSRNYDYACNLAIRHITIREAEIASLKRQLRQEGLRPYNEPVMADDTFFEKELGMLFRMMCCWAKRFYKFPTGEPLSASLQSRILQICEDPHNEQYLMANNHTKHLVVVSFAARWIVDEILSPRFLDCVVRSLMDRDDNSRNAEGFQELLESAEGMTHNITRQFQC
jgi:hypothetical protein